MVMFLMGVCSFVAGIFGGSLLNKWLFSDAEAELSQLHQIVGAYEKQCGYYDEYCEKLEQDNERLMEENLKMAQIIDAAYKIAKENCEP